MVCLHFTLVTLKNQSHGHSDLEGLYLIFNVAAEYCHLPYQLQVSGRASMSLDLLFYLIGGIRLIVGFQPLMVISPTASWIPWYMQVYVW